MFSGPWCRWFSSAKQRCELRAKDTINSNSEQEPGFFGHFRQTNTAPDQCGTSPSSFLGYFYLVPGCLSKAMNISPVFGRILFLRAFFTSRTPIWSSTLGNLTLQWKIHYVQVYFLFGTCDFHCCVRLLEVRWRLHLISRLLCMATPLLPRTTFLACNRKASIPQLCLKVKQVVDYSRWMMEW